MVELGLEGADAGGRRAQFDDQVADLRLGDQRPQRLPALPAVARLEAEDLAAPRADQRAGARQRVGRHVDRHRQDRLEQHRPRLRQRLAERDLGRGAERHVGGIDGVIGAVDQRHGDVDHREAERPAVQRVARAHLDRGKVLPRHRAAVDAARRRRSPRRARAAPPRPARRRTGRGRPTASCGARAPSRASRIVSR